MIPDEPVRGSYAYLEHPWLLGLPGVEQFRPFLKRQVPLPPLYHLSGLRVVEVGPGMTTWAMPASPVWQSGAGPFLPSVFAFVADAALGSAVYTTLPTGAILATSELSMSFLRPATPESGELIARSRLIQAGRGQGYSEATVADAEGRLLAHATSRLVITPLPFEPPPPPDDPPAYEAPTYDTPDPHLRPPRGVVQPQTLWDGASGLEVVQRWQKGELEPPPCGHLVGWRCLEVEEGKSAWAMPASEWFTTAYRSFYGGALALLVDGALNAAITTTLPPGDSYGTLDLKIHFLRPVEPDGRDLRAQARVVHRGRRVVVATAEAENADGKRIAMATSSAMVLPGRPWQPRESTPAMDESPVEDG